MTEQPCPENHIGMCFPAPLAHCQTHDRHQCGDCHRNPSECTERDHVACGYWVDGMHDENCPNRRNEPESDTPADPLKAEQPKPRASVIEIVGTGHQYTEDGGGSILLPQEVWINGVSVYTAKGSPVRISDIHVGEELVTVNLTLVARRIVIAADSDLREQP